MTGAPIRLEDAGKRYTKYEDAPMLVTAALRFRSRTKRSQLWAVRHVDLRVEEGECVGVIGRNGSGKSTTLQMLAGVTAPTEGLVAVRGRVAPLISVGVGFHPELTGRENVYVNGTILGLTRRQIDERFDEIVEFSEIAPFIDTPVKFYSSGMFVRLGFAVAVQAEPDVLLVDEVLAVGDIAFQMKCFDRMQQIRARGTTIVVVSHNLNAVRRLCDRTVVLHAGAVRFDGDTPGAISLYHDLMSEAREPEEDELDTVPRVRQGAARVIDVDLLDANGASTRHLRTGAHTTLRIEVEFDDDVATPVFGMSLRSADGVNVYTERTPPDHVGPRRAGGRAVCTISFDAALMSGSFALLAGIHDANVQLDIAPALHFYVTGRDFAGGLADLGARFDVDTEQRTDR